MDLSQFHWRKSSFSQGDSSDCVEVASNVPHVIAVRDSKDPQGGAHVIKPTSWQSFVASVKAGHITR